MAVLKSKFFIYLLNYDLEPFCNLDHYVLVVKPKPNRHISNIDY